MQVEQNAGSFLRCAQSGSNFGVAGAPLGTDTQPRNSKPCPRGRLDTLPDPTSKQGRKKAPTLRHPCLTQQASKEESKQPSNQPQSVAVHAGTQPRYQLARLGECRCLGGNAILSPHYCYYYSLPRCLSAAPMRGPVFNRSCSGQPCTTCPGSPGACSTRQSRTQGMTPAYDEQSISSSTVRGRTSLVLNTKTW